jgi:hypothetical protein
MIYLARVAFVVLSSWIQLPASSKPYFRTSSAKPNREIRHEQIMTSSFAQSFKDHSSCPVPPSPPVTPPPSDQIPFDFDTLHDLIVQIALSFTRTFTHLVEQ